MVDNRKQENKLIIKEMEIVYGILIGIVVSVGIFFILKSRLKKEADTQNEASVQALEMRMKSMMPEMMENLINIANDKLGSEKKEIKTDLDNKRQQIEKLVTDIQKELENNQKELREAEKDRVGSFNTLKQKLDQQNEVTEKLRVTADNLKNLLSNNQLRGQFGEKVAEDLLKMAGFVIGVNYNLQSGSEGSRPDISIYLPDKTIINIDAKFPYSNLQKYTEADDPALKTKYLADFQKDVKDKIKQVTTRDYINIENNTVDFVILFIPNEMIFSFIYEKLNDVWNDAMTKKVILAGPFSFTAILRMVQQAYENFRYQGNIREIVGHVKEFVNEFDKYNECVDSVGKKIGSLSDEYQKLSTTRTNKLLKIVNQVKLDDNETEQKKLLE